jgi:hypothetical protein
MKKNQLSLEEKFHALLMPVAQQIAQLARLDTLDQLRGAFATGIGEALDKSAADAVSLRWAGRLERLRTQRKERPFKFPERRAKGQKRTAVQLEQETARVLAYLRRRRGTGFNVEAIGKGLENFPSGAPAVLTRDLVLPLQRLLHEGKITKKGARRATRYSAT